MKAGSRIGVEGRRSAGTTLPGLAVATAAGVLLVAIPATHAVEPDKPGSATQGAVKLEPIGDGATKRVILAAKAAERLGIETSKVREEPIIRKQMVGGLVTAPQPAPVTQTLGKVANIGFARPPTAVRETFGMPSARSPAAADPTEPPPTVPISGEAWVLVPLSNAEWDRLAKDKPARIIPLAADEKPFRELWALPSGTPPTEDPKRSMLTARYVVANKDHGLTLNKRVRVELEVSGSQERRKVVPYAAVYYDAKGATWVYVNTQPLVFERRRIAIERIAGDLAVLTDGPPVGTPIVVVGAPLLYGAEIFGK